MINASAVNGLRVAMSRTPEMHVQYQQYLKEKSDTYGDNIPCPFDRGVEGGLEEHEIVEEYRGILIARPTFPYIVDNGQRVEEHYMILPPEHVHDVHELSPERAHDFNETLTYVRTELGWTIMMRANTDVSKSVHHAHAHCFVYGPRVIFQYYNREANENVVLFEGEEEKIPHALGRAGLAATHESA